MSFKININLKSLHISKKNVVTGSINLQINDRYFPDEGWNDFIVIILDWWVKGFYEFAKHNYTFCRCYFMDGDYKFTLTGKGDKLKIHLFDSDDVVIDSIFISKKEFVETLLSHSTEVINECRKLKWSTPEISQLIDNTHDLGKLFKMEIG